MVNKNVLSCLLKDCREVDAVTLVGRLFHACATVTRNGNLQDWNLQDWKMTDEVAGVEFEGLENDGLENDGVEQEQTYAFKVKPVLFEGTV